MGQLLWKSHLCSDDAAELFASKGKDPEAKLKTSEALALLLEMSTNFKVIYLIIDALDESSEVAQVFEVLSGIVSTGPDSLWRVLFTSRPQVQIQQLLSPRRVTKIPFATIALDQNNQNEIAVYMKNEVEGLHASASCPSGIAKLSTTIIDTVVGQSQGLSVKPKLQLEYLCSLETVREVRNALTQPTLGLYETYDRMLDQLVL